MNNSRAAPIRIAGILFFWSLFENAGIANKRGGEPPVDNTQVMLRGVQVAQSLKQNQGTQIG